MCNPEAIAGLRQEVVRLRQEVLAISKQLESIYSQNDKALTRMQRRAEKAFRQPRRFENSIKLDPDWHSDEERYTVPLTTPEPQPQRPPWTPKAVRINEQLTTFEYAVKSQLGQAGLVTIAGFCAGLIMVLTVDNVPWWSFFPIGLAGGLVALLVFVIQHRSQVNHIVKSSNQKTTAQSKELTVNVRHAYQHKAEVNHDFLYLNGKITREDLRLMAQGVLSGRSLAVNAWSGVGGWTRNKVDSFLGELEAMQYVTPGKGNKARQLTSKGKALFRALAE